jgi:hypothetical protein
VLAPARKVSKPPTPSVERPPKPGKKPDEPQVEATIEGNVEIVKYEGDDDDDD